MDKTTLKDVDDLLQSLEEAFQNPVKLLDHGSSEEHQHAAEEEQKKKKKYLKQRSPTVANDLNNFPTFDEFINSSATESDNSLYGKIKEETSKDAKNSNAQNQNNTIDVSSNSSGVEYSSDYLKMLRNPRLSVKMTSASDYPPMMNRDEEYEVEVPDQLENPPEDAPPAPPEEAIPISASEDDSPPDYNPPEPVKTNSSDTLAQLDEMTNILEQNFSSSKVDWNNSSNTASRQSATFNPHLRKADSEFVTNMQGMKPKPYADNNNNLRAATLTAQAARDHANKIQNNRAAQQKSGMTERAEPVDVAVPLKNPGSGNGSQYPVFEKKNSDNGLVYNDNNQEEIVWKEYISSTTGKSYFYNTLTKKTTWHRPTVYIPASTHTGTRNSPNMSRSNSRENLNIISPEPSQYPNAPSAASSQYPINSSDASAPSIQRKMGARPQTGMNLNPTTTNNRTSLLMQAPLESIGAHTSVVGIKPTLVGSDMHPNLDPQRVNRKVRPLSEGVKEVTLTVGMADEVVKKIKCTVDFLVQDVIVSVAEKIDLWQIEYFSLARPSSDNVDRWLHPDRLLEEEGITQDCDLHLKVKYLKTPRKLVDPVATRLFVCQIHRKLVSGDLPCPDHLRIRLAALWMQLNHGDFLPGMHRIGYFTAASLQAVVPGANEPPIGLNFGVKNNTGVQEKKEKSKKEKSEANLRTSNSNNTLFWIEYLQSRLFKSYSRLMGMTRREAEGRYYELSKKIPLWNVTFHNVTESGSPRRLGVGEDGLYISRKDNRDLVDFFHFSELAGWNQTTTGLEVRVANPDKKSLFSFVTEQKTFISELLCEYYILLQEQVDLPRIPLPIVILPQSLPPVALYSPPTDLVLNRAMPDPHGSRLELLKMHYFEESVKECMLPMELFLAKMDAALDVEGGDVTELDMSNLGLDKVRLEILAKSLLATFKYETKTDRIFLENLNLKTWRVSGNPGAYDALPTIGAVLEAPFLILKEFHINNVKLGSKGMQALSLFLENSRTLEFMSFQDCELGNTGVKILTKILRTKRNITGLDLSRNNFDEKVAEEVGDLFVRTGSMTWISLAGNRLGDTGVSAFIAMLRKSASKNIEHLDVSAVGLKGAAAVDLMVWVNQNSQLKTFIVSQNEISDKAGLNLAKNLTDTLSKLSHLEVALCALGSKPMHEICENVGVNRRLERLNLAYNIIKKKSLLALNASLERNHSIVNLSVRGCQLSKSGLVEFLKVIRKHSNLKKLDVALNDFSASELVKEIHETFTYHSMKIEEINMGGTNMGASGVTAISTALGINTTLKILRLDKNKIGKFLPKLAEGIKDSKSLEEITLKDVGATKKDVGEFLTIISTGPGNLKRIALDRNHLEPDMFADKLKLLGRTKVTF